MNFQEFIPQALRTESTLENPKTVPVMLEAGLNLASNISEVLDAFKKNTYYGKEFEYQKIDTILDNIIMNAASTRLMMRQFSQMAEEPKNQMIAEVSTFMNPRVLHALLGIFTESGELLNNVGKKDDEIDLVNIKEELGDIEYYNALLCDALNIDIEHCYTAVIAKLKSRYPEKFTTGAAIDRDVDAERKILEDASL